MTWLIMKWFFISAKEKKIIPFENEIFSRLEIRTNK